jgi:hypothetical protein
MAQSCRLRLRRLLDYEIRIYWRRLRYTPVPHASGLRIRAERNRDDCATAL